MRPAAPLDRPRPIAGRPGRGWTAALGLAIAVLAAACATPAEETASTPDAVGPPATQSSGGPTIPDVALTTFAGDTADLHEFVGTPLVVNFWASWCPPCAAEMPDFEAVSQQLDGQVRFVGINTSDDPGLAEDLAERTGVTYDLLRDPDGQAFRAFGGFGMPTTAFVAADGTVQQTHTGFLTREALVGEIQQWLDVAVPS